MKKITFVIPCYRSENTLKLVVDEIEQRMLNYTQYKYNIILINDCSPDNTLYIIKTLCNNRKNIRGISLSKNFGQHAALMAGLSYSDGDYVICLDDDGQTPANEVDKLLLKLNEGYDVVYAKYEHKQHSVFRNIGSWINDRMLCIMLGKPKDLYMSSYFGVKRFVVDEMLRYVNSYPYVIGLVLRSTKNITNVNVTHRERVEGVSGYSIKKLISLWFNGFTAFSVIPLRIATGIGGLSAVAGFIYGLYTIIKRLHNPDIPVGFSSSMSAFVFFGGLIMLTLGLLGEYIGRIYISLNNSPQYVIKEKFNLND